MTKILFIMPRDESGPNLDRILSKYSINMNAVRCTNIPRLSSHMDLDPKYDVVVICTKDNLVFMRECVSIIVKKSKTPIIIVQSPSVSPDYIYAYNNRISHIVDYTDSHQLAFCIARTLKPAKCSGSSANAFL